MLLSITTTARDATDLGHLLRKHPDRVFRRDLSVGTATVFYPEATADRCTAVLLLEVDAVGRAKRDRGDGADRYVNDRPYVAGSLLAVALGRVFNAALAGTAEQKTDRLEERWPLELRLPALPCRGGGPAIRRAFEPLGYAVEVDTPPLDPQFPEWGDAPASSVTLSGEQTIRAALNHLAVLLPALSGDVHYFVGEADVAKLVRRGETWLADHPDRDRIVRRALRWQAGLANDALARLGPSAEENSTPGDDADGDAAGDAADREERVPLNRRRHAAVLGVLKDSGARSVADLGCGPGQFLKSLLRTRRFTRVLGADVSPAALAAAERRLNLERLPPRVRDRLELIQSSLLYRDDRLRGFDAAVLMEVVEHLDPPRLSALETAVFAHARPAAVLVTTPNREYNPVWESLPAGAMRHPDHRFEWDRAEFRAWCESVCERNGYMASFHPIGDEHPEFGPPTQMAVFTLDTPD